MVIEQKLHSLGKIHIFFVSGDTMKTRFNENSFLPLLTQVDDFKKHFPNADLSPTSPYN